MTLHHNLSTASRSLSRYLSRFADFFLPRACVICETALDEGEEMLCLSCYDDIPEAVDDLSEYAEMKNFAGERMPDDFHALFIFEEDHISQQLIHLTKYRQRFKLGEYLGKRLAGKIIKEKRHWEYDLVLPVPLHRLREAERGYNQAASIGLGAAHILDRPLQTGNLIRHRSTETQVSLSMEKRVENVAGAFSIKDSALIRGKNILLIDDVITTGATTGECIATLKQEGAAKVYAASAAIVF